MAAFAQTSLPAPRAARINALREKHSTGPGRYQAGQVGCSLSVVPSRLPAPLAGGAPRARLVGAAHDQAMRRLSPAAGNERRNLKDVGFQPTRRVPAVRCVLRPASKPQEPSLPTPTLLGGVLEPTGFVGSPEGVEGWRVIPDIWGTQAKECPDAVALLDPHHPGQPKYTYKELNDTIMWFADGLKSLGLGKGETVALFAENSCRWLIADQGVMSCGANDAVRGTKSSAKELQYILSHCDSVGVIVEDNATLEKLRPLFEDEECCPRLKFAVVLWPPAASNPLVDAVRAESGHSVENGAPLPSFGFPVLSFEGVVDEGRSILHNSELRREKRSVEIREDDIATMVFTSGTTGEPKAVMLTHANLMHQMRAYRNVLSIEQGDVLLSLLPPWHMYERSCEYFALGRGAEQIYSGVKTFKEDIVKFKPDIFVAVPLVFDVLYNGVQRKLSAASGVRAAVIQWLLDASLAFMEAVRKWKGMALPASRNSADPRGGEGEGWEWLEAAVRVIISGALACLLYPLHLLASKLVYSKVKEAVPIRKMAVSGGGSLAPHVDKFFEAVGLTVLNGYGLTETSPVLAVRRPNHNVLGTVGSPIAETQVKVVDAETGATLPDGSRGIVKGKGPQIMKGYYKNPAATAAIIDAEGWLDTGDIGWITPETSFFGPSRNCGRQLVLEGRAKDTIVLANGENIEPAWVEEAALQSPAISQIMLLGQDQRRLGALVVPSKEEVAKMVRERRSKAGAESPGQDPSRDEMKAVIRDELQRCLLAAGCGPNGRIGHFELLEEPFTVENGLLTPTMKMRRNVIHEKYKQVCETLFDM